MTLSAFGMNLHAATTADGRDRKQLERICHYLLRPPFAHDAVMALPGGRVRVSFKAPWRGGTAHADMDAHQFLARPRLYPNARAPPRRRPSSLARRRLSFARLRPRPTPCATCCRALSTRLRSPIGCPMPARPRPVNGHPRPALPMVGAGRARPPSPACPLSRPG